MVVEDARLAAEGNVWADNRRNVELKVDAGNCLLGVDAPYRREEAGENIEAVELREANVPNRHRSALRRGGGGESDKGAPFCKALRRPQGARCIYVECRCAISADRRVCSDEQRIVQN